LYNGSGGGTGYDISWAQDGGGQSVFLPSISFIRVDVLSGKSEIDAIAAVPEPKVLPLALLAGLALVLWRRTRSADFQACRTPGFNPAPASTALRTSKFRSASPSGRSPAFLAFSRLKVGDTVPQARDATC